MPKAHFNIVHFHFHHRKTGVTKSIEQLLPFLQTKASSAVFGYGIDANKFGLGQLLKQLFSKAQTVVHVHRNKEMMFALFLRLVGGRFSLFATRHSATPPSGLTRFLMNQADRKIFLTEDAPFDTSSKNSVIPHGVDLTNFSPAASSSEEKKLIGVVGRIRKTKGQKVVLTALASFLKKRPDWQLTFIGKIDQKQYAQEIQDLAQLNDITQQLTFLGQTEQINAFYRRCTLVVVPSFSEGFSLVPLEAISSGCTVIATENVGVHSSLIQVGENGYLFPAGDQDALREIVENIVENNRFFPVETLRRSIAKWDIKNIAEQTFAAYKSSI
jgi:mannosyltransferase